MVTIFTTFNKLFFSKVDFGKISVFTTFAAGCSNEHPIYET